MKYFVILLFVTLIFVMNNAEARGFSDFSWKIDEIYHRDGHVQFVVQKGSENFLPIGIYGKSDVTVNLHPTIGNDQIGPAKLPRGVDIYFEPSRITVAEGEIKTVKLIINVDKNAPANLYDVQIIGKWKEEDKIRDFMGSSIRLHVGRDFGDGKIPVNMLESPLKFWKSVRGEEGVTVNDIPCRNDYVLVVKSSTQTPACVTLETKEKLIQRGWTEIYPDTYGVKSVFEVVKDDTIFDVEYEIKGGIVQDMIYDADANLILVTMDVTEELVTFSDQITKI